MSRTLVSNEDTHHQTAKRASYRLFPVVTPTPPASPVFARLSQSVDSLQCRSSSVRYGVKSPQRHTTSSLSIPTIRPDNHGDDKPKTRPQSALEGVKLDRDPRCTRVSMPSTSARHPDAITIDRLSESNSGTEGRTRSDGDEESTMAFRSTTPTSPQSENHDLTSIFPLAPTFTSHQDRSRVRNKPKPNLRINVGDHAVGDLPPPPPPKSPRRLPTPPSGLSKADSQSPRSADTRRASFDSTTTMVPSVAVQASYVPLGTDKRVREFNVQSAATKERPSRKLLPQFLSSTGTSNTTERPPPLLRKPVSRLNSVASDSSPDATPDVSLQLPSIRSASPISLSKSESPIDESQRKRYVAYRPPTAPHIRSDSNLASEKTTPLQWSSRSHNPPSFDTANRSNSPDSTLAVLRSDALRSTSPTDSSLISSSNTTVRRVVNAGPLNSNPYIPSPMLPPASNPTILEPTTFSRSMTPGSMRLGSADIASSTGFETVRSGSPETSDRNRTSPPGFPAGAFSRAITPELSSTASRASSIAFMDPVERLKELTEKCEVLHAKYAGLRADRQKLSSGIIASLKAAKPDAEALSAILDEQLSLVAVSSAMDICFAKLQALECQKEDAVASLIAQLGSLKRTTVDSIAGSPARNITHPRNQPSSTLEPLARFGRLTPEYAEMDRFPQPRRLPTESEILQQTRDVGSPTQEATPRADEQRSPLHFPTTTEAWPRSDSVISGDMRKKAAFEHELSNVDEDQNKESISVLEEILPGDALDEGTRKLRVDGPKAARILGLLARSDSRKASSAARVPDGFEDMLLRKQPELELEISSIVRPKAPRDQDPGLREDVSPTSSPGEGIDFLGAAVGPHPSAHPPRPSTPTMDTALPTLSSARYGSPVKAPPPCPPSDDPEVPASPKSLKSVKSFKSIKSYKSTKKGYLHQTIKVFMDDDILEYYRALQGWSSNT